MPLRFVTVLVSLLCIAGRADAQELRPRFRMSDAQRPFDKRLQFEAAAPIIVIGVVLRAEEIGPPQSTEADPRVKAQLTRVLIWVEQLIKGSVEKNPAEFLYYAFSLESEVDLKPRYMPDYLDRRIFFLAPSGNVLRSVGDVLDYTLRVSGGIPDTDTCKGKSPGCCIAELLLVPGRRLDVDSFANGILQSANIAEVLCSRNTALDLMMKLARHPNQRIADAAREAIRVTASR